jgi:hypothetical protein
MPSVMPMSDKKTRGPAERRAGEYDVAVVQDEQHAGEPERETEPLHARDALAHEAVGDGRGQNRLQPGDQRGDAGRHALRNRDEHAAEIDAVHQQADHDRVPDLRPPRPRRARDKSNRQHQHDDGAHAQRQERQRLGIRQTVARADEARAPQ